MERGSERQPASGKGFLNARELLPELPQLVKAHVHAPVLYAAIRHCDFEDERCARQVNTLAVLRGDFVPEDHLEIAELLQPHQTRHRPERIRVLRLGVDRVCKPIHRHFLLDARALHDLLFEQLLRGVHLLGSVGREVGDHDGLEGVAHAANLLERPGDALVLELARDALRRQLLLRRLPVRDLACNLGHQVLDKGRRELLNRRQVRPRRHGELLQVERRSEHAAARLRLFRHAD